MLSLDMLPAVATEESWYGAVDAGLMSLYPNGFDYHERVTLGGEYDQERSEYGQIRVTRFDTRHMAPTHRGGHTGR